MGLDHGDHEDDRQESTQNVRENGIHTPPFERSPAPSEELGNQTEYEDDGDPDDVGNELNHGPNQSERPTESGGDYLANTLAHGTHQNHDSENGKRESQQGFHDGDPVNMDQPVNQPDNQVIEYEHHSKYSPLQYFYYFNYSIFLAISQKDQIEKKFLYCTKKSNMIRWKYKKNIKNIKGGR